MTAGGADPERAGRDPMRRSVEVEYWVVDETGRLTEPGDLLDAAPGVEREFTVPLLEVKTTPCESTAELRGELFDRLDRVLRRADEVGKGLVPLATPLAPADIEDHPAERTRIQDRVLGEEFEYVRHCAGTHIHVEQQPGQEIAQLNALVALDPALALVNSAPYFDGEYLAASARSQLYRSMAYDALPHQGQLWPYVADRTDWGQRLQRRYDEFVTEAVITGFDRDTVEACFDPESAAWTPVKLRQAFSTVEWRSPDAALPSQVVSLCDDLVGVVERVVEDGLTIEGTAGEVTDDGVVVPEFETVERYVDAAIQHGLDSPSVRAYLAGLGFDVEAYDPLTEVVAGDEELTPDAARETRLRYADRLKSDVRAEKPAYAD